METDAIITVISTLGFPIAACIALFWYMTKQQENHKTEMDGLKESLNENTTVLTSLKEILNMILQEIRKND